MIFKKFKFVKSIMLLLMAIMVITLTACNGDDDVVEEVNYTVIYDGNGGYLGNKTYSIRKLQVAENSKLPKYLSEYTQDPYVVSSLGLANRIGYTLIGWYLEENATYQADVLGSYIYLDTDDGNGAYRINELGEYVYGYIQDDAGTLIYVNVQPLGEDDDEETTQYIYFNGGDGYGFYIYDEGNANHVSILEASGSYLLDDLDTYGISYMIYDELSVDEQDLFADIPKYSQAYYEYTEADEGLTRFTFDSAYVNFHSIMVLDPEGLYVLDGSEYFLFDEENDDHLELHRYSVDERYIFTATDTIVSPSQMDKYSATFVYWDFENQRVTEDMVLFAHWEKKLTVEYIQKSGQTTYLTQKLLEDNVTTVDFAVGEPIGKVETIPTYTDPSNVEYTFVGWSLSETEYIPWDFDNDVFPPGIITLTLYAYMIEGEYTRITSATRLAEVANDPDGKYLLVNDIDLEGQEFLNESPLGFTVRATASAVAVPFTGEFISMGYKISNYTIVVQNTQKLLNSLNGVIVVMGLFPYVQDAVIDGVILENVSITLETVGRAASVVCDLGGAGLIGTALDGNTVVSNVTVDVTITATGSNPIDFPVYIGDIIAKDVDNVTISNSTSTIDYSTITAEITTSTLEVHTLD
ncbi:InlB B-repeat-containing protein [Mycoplasmatota bacterium WC30]